jgi:hypothetical protein
MKKNSSKRPAAPKPNRRVYNHGNIGSYEYLLASGLSSDFWTIRVVA